jgi:diguanylate cyclase (GGDEF)-like protein
MCLDSYQVNYPACLAQHLSFVKNVEDRWRYLLTFKDGSHLVGVPTSNPDTDPTDDKASFDVVTEVAYYRSMPFRILAFAEKLGSSGGLRPSDGIPTVPEPCRGPLRRPKHEKFGILDSPTLLMADLHETCAYSGTILLFLDVDGFKTFNTKFTERVVDATLLPELQRSVLAFLGSHGFVYAEGGDEIVVLLANSTMEMGIAFAEALRNHIASIRFKVSNEEVALTVSIGMTSSMKVDTVDSLPELANKAKAEAKVRGKNRTIATTDGVSFFEVVTAHLFDAVSTGGATVA